ncbi:MAG: SUMF1/EgtB/PvdO family nonheme iron enzyme [Planctomycetaceae bacterium]
MNCLCRTHSDADPHPLLLQYAAGTLPTEQVEVVLQAIRVCDVCRKKLESVVVDDELMRSLRLPEPELSHLDDPECNSAMDSVRRMVDEILNPDSDLTQRSDETAHQSESSSPDYDVKVIGQYRIREILGKGGMGTVYKGIHPQLEKVVAIKLLKADLSKDQNAVARFQREMKAVGRLDHPNIVRATDAGTADGHMFLVMEYVDGVDLRSLVDMGGPLTVADACEIIRQSAVGLYHAHEHGLVHRDIKPNNIRLSRQGYAKILDLGLARVTWDEGPGGAGQLTQTSQICGTYDYMPPEQWESTHQVDHRGDIYSLGCTFYFLLTGHAPFDHPKYRGNYLSKMRAHLIEPAPPIGEWRQDVPAEVIAVLDKMLAKDPDHRFASAAEVVYALDPFCRENRLPELVGPGDRPGSGVITQPLSHPSALLAKPRSSSASLVAPMPTPASMGMRIGFLAFGLVGAIGIGVLVSQLLNHSSQNPSASPGGNNTTQPLNVASAASTTTDVVAPTTNAATTDDFGEKTIDDSAGEDDPSPPKMNVATTTDSAKKLRPIITKVPAATIPEKQMYRVTLHLENEAEVKGKLEFVLADDAPNGASINPQTGQFSWTPGEKDGPGEFVLAVQLISVNEAVESAAVSWSVDVQEVNDAPALEQPKNYVIDEMKTLEFAAQATDADEPANALKFELSGDVPQGAAVDPVTGQFEWTPTESQGPGEYTISLKVSDDGKPSLSVEKTFNVVVKEINQPPKFEPLAYEYVDEQGNYLLGTGETLRVTLHAEDDDLPAQKLKYQLAEGAPEHVQLDTETGELTWATETGDTGKDFQFDVLAVETAGDEPLSARQTLSFHVEHYLRNSIGMRLASIPAGQFRMGNMSGEIGLPGFDDLIPETPPAKPGDPNAGGNANPNPNPAQNLNPNVNAKVTLKPPEYPKDERPVRTIRLTRDFHMSAHEVTQEQFLAVMGVNPSYYSVTGDGAKDVAEVEAGRLPVESVTWDEAVEFCRKLSERPEEKAAGRRYRLPTEAEWEYACRAGKTGKESDFSTGASLSSKQANFNGTAAVHGAEPGPFVNRTMPVGSYAPNAWGLFDMHGNVAEWCHDWYSSGAYKEIVHENPAGPQPDKLGDEQKLESKVIRGGSWYDHGFECRSSKRYKHRPYEKTRMLGFRVVCETAGDVPAINEAAATNDDPLQ